MGLGFVLYIEDETRSVDYIVLVGGFEQGLRSKVLKRSRLLLTSPF